MGLGSRAGARTWFESLCAAYSSIMSICHSDESIGSGGHARIGTDCLMNMRGHDAYEARTRGHRGRRSDPCRQPSIPAQTRVDPTFRHGDAVACQSLNAPAALAELMDNWYYP